MNVVIDGLIINYQDIGDKKNDCILFLHGWADDSSSFEDLAGSLSGKYRCIALDFPGFGRSEQPKRALTLPDFADITKKFLDKIQAKPYALAGHSNGGAIAINAVAQKKANPKKIILIASSGLRSGQKVKKTVYKILAKPAKAGLVFVPRSKREKIKQRIYGKIGSDYLVAENMKDTFKNIVAYDVSANAANIKVPVLLLYGSEDTATPPDMGRRLHDLIKGSRLKIIDGAGHFVHHDAKREVAEAAADFLK